MSERVHPQLKTHVVQKEQILLLLLAIGLWHPLLGEIEEDLSFQGFFWNHDVLIFDCLNLLLSLFGFLVDLLEMDFKFLVLVFKEQSPSAEEISLSIELEEEIVVQGLDVFEALDINVSITHLEPERVLSFEIGSGQEVPFVVIDVDCNYF